ncbi:unnamed protein product [Darwinula stevensoni]|uniref:Triacylglycerol lipase n=1 Tax=Darwinula stevensoni TaxID=69355 RepID=A0A7R9FNC1_9CRUS|nr:unnamed protein product [Darwinula stevensoni]CAG0896314.1 unnamed protein product [Darwinula stevensoni]
MSNVSMLALALLSLASASYSRVLEDGIKALIGNGFGVDVDPHESLKNVREMLMKKAAEFHHQSHIDPLKFPPEVKDDLDRDTPGLIAQHGYPAETYTVTTADGYIIDMHRIPYGLNGPGEGPRIPVMLQHGLLCSSADWVVTGPERAFGKSSFLDDGYHFRELWQSQKYFNLRFMLADAGYDVWLGNVRGNTYGKRHVSLSTSDEAFWAFSWDQMGEFDLPAMLDKIFEVTGQDKLQYVGHSMGTMMFWVMSNMRPEYRDHFLSMHGMGPVSRVDHMFSPLRLIAPFTNQLQVRAENGKKIIEFGLDWFHDGGDQLCGGNWIGLGVTTSPCTKYG